MKRIADCLEGRVERNHILPFFWQHGEDTAVLAEEMDAMERCHIREFCVESRPYEHFGEDPWWRDMGFLLQEARRRGMRVWLLDDKFFPTGYANRYLETHPELRKVSLRMEYRDFSGPAEGCTLLFPPLDEEERVLFAVAYPRRECGRLLYGAGVELTLCPEDGRIAWDIPEGVWRGYYLIRTYRVYSERERYFIDMLSPASCDAMLHAVYEPHYAHFAEYFGNTFAGFFSDEPSFGNKSYDYYSALGTEEMLLPWRDDLPELMAGQAGYTPEEIRLLLPALWHEIEGRTSIVREAYMEVITRLYRRNFSQRLGDWCRAHGVEYIGHVIEDMNTHQRLGYGSGHYFRALDGQDMAGIDVVLHQIIPGLQELNHAACVTFNNADPEFFHYTLPKLCASHAHIQPLKKNRALCEIYGAYGWAEGIPLMKYLTDLMLCCGIRYFVPHAFSPKYPDPDCPPHFYARGHNPQFALFGDLMEYTARLCHAMSGGVHRADVAVYYNAEAEWSGGRNMLQQKICKELTRHYIDFDLLPQDTLCEEASVRDGRLTVHEESYGALIVPYSQYLPERVLSAMGRLAERGVPVWFADAFPEACSEGRPLGRLPERCRAVPFERMAGELIAAGWQGLRPQEDGLLRFYHLVRGGDDFFFLWNEDAHRELDTWVTVPAGGRAFFYDAWRNTVTRAAQRDAAVRVRLAPTQGLLLCMTDQDMTAAPYDYRDGPTEEPETAFTVSLRREGESDFVPLPGAGLGNLAGRMPHFAGVIRYETQLTDAEASLIGRVELGTVGETAELWVNGVSCGRIASLPYVFETAGKFRDGRNDLRVEVIPNNAYRERDPYSGWLALPPMGWVGPLRIAKEPRKA